VCAAVLDAAAGAWGEDLTLETEGDLLVVSSGAARVRLYAFQPEEFPSFRTAAAGSEEWVLPRGVLTELLAVSFCMSKDEGRYVLCGLHVESREGQLLGVATDGRRLARVELELPGLKDSRRVTIPRRAVEWLQRNGIGEEEEALVTIDEELLEVRTRGCWFSTVLVAGNYPNWRQVIPEMEEEGQRIVPAEWLARLRAVAVATTPNHVGVKVVMRGNRVTLSANTPELGDATDEGDLFSDAEGVIEAEFMVGVGMMDEAIRAVGASAEYWEAPARLWPSDGSKALVMQAGRLLHVLMPMRAGN